LFALFILSVGILGTSAMVSNSFRFTDAAALQTQSVALAYDLADKIRANSQSVGSYSTDVGDTYNNPPDCASASCSSGQIAQADLADWKTKLASNLPSGDGATVITADDATINVQWSDRGTARTYSLVVAL